MAGTKHLDPFEVWRSQQADATPEPPEQKQLALSPAREALRNQAFDRMWDELEHKRAGEPNRFNETSAELVGLNRRLYDEEAAELGFMPTSAAGAISVLNVAANIINLLAQ